MVAHWNPPIKSTSITKFIPQLSTLLQTRVAADETLLLLLRYAHAQANGTTAAVPIDTVIQPLIELCSISPDSTQRNTAFVTLSLLLRTLPPPARMAALAELLSPETDPFPQMRVAAVGLVKESVLEALSSTSAKGGGQSVGQVNAFASPQLLTQLGRYLLRTEPPDLFPHRVDTFDVNDFLDSSEPVRLAECLGLYYALLIRDVSNKARDQCRPSAL